MLDAADERRAAMNSLDPLVVQRSRSVRLTSLVLGVPSFALGLVLAWFHVRYIAGLVLSLAVGELGMAAFFTPRVAARHQLRRKTDITRFASVGSKEPR
jgi:hypothetical protein